MNGNDLRKRVLASIVGGYYQLHVIISIQLIYFLNAWISGLGVISVRPRICNNVKRICNVAVVCKVYSALFTGIVEGKICDWRRLDIHRLNNCIAATVDVLSLEGNVVSFCGAENVGWVGRGA